MSTKRLPSPEHADTLSLKALRGLVTGLLERAERAEQRLERLERENAALRLENETLRLENTRLKLENQQLRDEIARLKALPPRPPFKPSGMDKATDGARDRPAGSKKTPRGAKRDREETSRVEIVRMEVPEGARFKGYRSAYTRDLILRAELVHYRRECFVLPDGRVCVAPLPAGIRAGYGANVRRFCLMLHAAGQVTTRRLTTLLNDIGLSISRRQVVRLLTEGLDGFAAEDEAVLHAGLVSSPFLAVDDTGARHAGRNGFTTRIGGDHFTVLRTTATKSRLNFLSLLRGSYQDYVLNDAALSYLEARGAEAGIVERLRHQAPLLFSHQVPFLTHLAERGIDILDRGRVRLLAEAGIWGAIRHHGLLGKAVILSDDAGQFRVGEHALCWVHAERNLQKLMPANGQESRWLGLVRDLVWTFYKALKAYRRKPSPALAAALVLRFERIFTLKTGYEALDRLLLRLYQRRSGLLKVLERPEIPLNTNAAERDLRSVVTKRKISGGTISRNGRIARDCMLGLMQTCRKLALSFWHYLGDRLGLAGPTVPLLSGLVLART